MRSGAPTELRILPFRGAYLKLRADRTHLVRGQIYPVPDPSLPFLGVHLSPTIHGDVLLGPTALLAGARDAYRLGRLVRADVGATLRWPGTAKLIRKWWRTGAREIVNAASRRLLVRDLARYVPALGLDDVEPGPAGRARPGRRPRRRPARRLRVRRDGARAARLNAPSPAATASLAIAAMVADRLDGVGPDRSQPEQPPRPAQGGRDRLAGVRRVLVRQALVEPHALDQARHRARKVAGRGVVAQPQAEMVQRVRELALEPLDPQAVLLEAGLDTRSLHIP